MGIAAFFESDRVTKIVAIVTGLVLALVLVILLQPSDFKVVRSAEIARSPGVIAGYVNDLDNWNNWSPWAKLDPEARYYFEGPRIGVGAKFHWEGDMNVGAGTMTIIEVKPGERVKMQLDFERPFAGRTFADFTFVRKGRGTQVTWTMTGRNSFLAKALGLFIDCNKMMGGFFETGLANLKEILET